MCEWRSVGEKAGTWSRRYKIDVLPLVRNTGMGLNETSKIFSAPKITLQSVANMKLKMLKRLFKLNLVETQSSPLK
jgi:nitric oxide synthase oxygenase domain/subunit